MNIFSIPIYNSSFIDLQGSTITKVNSPTTVLTKKGWAMNCEASQYIYSNTISGNFDTILLEFYLDDEVTAASVANVLGSVGGTEGRFTLGIDNGTYTNETFSWIKDSVAEGGYIKDNIPRGHNQIILIWNGSYYDCWLNGVQVTTYNNGSDRFGDDDVYIGKRETAAQYFTGKITNVVLAGHSYSNLEVAQAKRKFDLGAWVAPPVRGRVNYNLGNYGFNFNGTDNAIRILAHLVGGESIYYKSKIYGFDSGFYGSFFSCGGTVAYQKGCSLFYHKVIGFRLFVSDGTTQTITNLAGGSLISIGGNHEIEFSWSGVSGEDATIIINGVSYTNTINRDWIGSSPFYVYFNQQSYSAAYYVKGVINYILFNDLNIPLSIGYSNKIYDVNLGTEYTILGTVLQSQWVTQDTYSYNEDYGCTRVKYNGQRVLVPYLLDKTELYTSVAPVLNAAETTEEFLDTDWNNIYLHEQFNDNPIDSVCNIKGFKAGTGSYRINEVDKDTKELECTGNGTILKDLVVSNDSKTIKLTYDIGGGGGGGVDYEDTIANAIIDLAVFFSFTGSIATFNLSTGEKIINHIIISD